MRRGGRRPVRRRASSCRKRWRSRPGRLPSGRPRTGEMGWTRVHDSIAWSSPVPREPARPAGPVTVVTRRRRRHGLPCGTESSCRQAVRAAARIRLPTKRCAPRRRIMGVGIREVGPRLGPGAGAGRAPVADLEALLCGVSGVVRSVLRDPFQAEEVSQEVLLEVWRTAPRFQPGRGSAMAWVTTIAHRRAVDRVRSEHRSAERQQRAARHEVAYDEVAEVVEARLDREQVRRCLGSLTELQRESVTLAYYGGYTFREIAGLLGVAEGTVKTRMRDGLIRLRDCLGAD